MRVRATTSSAPRAAARLLADYQRRGPWGWQPETLDRVLSGLSCPEVGSSFDSPYPSRSVDQHHQEQLSK